MNKKLNSPRCPICDKPVHLWVVGADIIKAKCPNCDWEWTG